jgi:hypothetical protein
MRESLGASTCRRPTHASPQAQGPRFGVSHPLTRVPATYFIGATAQDVRLEAQLVSLGSRATEGQLLPAG